MRNYPNILTSHDWLALHPKLFEKLALRHVENIYPEYTWRPTSYSKDLGRDAVGTPRWRKHQALLRDALYWMEAKRHSRPMGRCGLDKHLVSVWTAGGDVKRLHLVASGGFAQPFKAHARSFAKDHDFNVAFSDGLSLAAWLYDRPRIVREYFGAHATVVEPKLAMVARLPSFLGVLAEAFILADDDQFDDITTVQQLLVPGEKYRLIVHISPFSAEDCTRTLDLRWPVQKRSVDLLGADALRKGVSLTQARREPVLEFEFRYGGGALAPLLLVDRRDGQHLSIDIDVQPGRRFLPKLVGANAESTVITVGKRVQGARAGKPSVVAITGRAGAGKSRIAAEARDIARRNGVRVKVLVFGTDERLNEEQWIRFFAWLFGISKNVFLLNERRLVESRLKKLLESSHGEWKKVVRHLAHMLKVRRIDDRLFGSTPEAQHFALLVERAIAQQDMPLVLHLEDAHHLSTRLTQPLWLLRRLLAPPSRLRALVTLTARNDETVEQTAIGSFIAAKEGLLEYEVHDLSEADATRFVRESLRIAPELSSEEGYFVSEIIDRVGTNPFALTQTIESILASDAAFEQRLDLGVVILREPAELENALKAVPEGVRQLLHRRFQRLVKLESGRTLFDVLLMAAILGRGASVSLIEKALNLRKPAVLLAKLVRLGYLKNVRSVRLELAHDLMSEALLRQDGKANAATMLARAIDAQRRPPVTREQRARVYYHAGQRFYRKSWSLLTQVVDEEGEKENYKPILSCAPMIDAIAKYDERAFAIDWRINARIAGAFGHSLKTSLALARYAAIAESLRVAAGHDSEAQLKFLEMRIQLANQHSTRGEIVSGLSVAAEALEIARTSRLPLSDRSRASVVSFALNRMAAMHKVVDEYDDAVRLFRESLEICRRISKHYLASNCLSNLATLYARRDVDAARETINEAIDITKRHLQAKGRRNIMVDTAKACVDCFESNDAAARFALRNCFIQAREGGYIGQISGALLPFAFFSLSAGKLDDARWAAEIVLDVSSRSEDWFARLFGRYYLAICYLVGGQTKLARAFARHTTTLIRDARVRASPVSGALRALARGTSLDMRAVVLSTRT